MLWLGLSLTLAKGVKVSNASPDIFRDCTGTLRMGEGNNAFNDSKCWPTNRRSTYGLSSPTTSTFGLRDLSLSSLGCNTPDNSRNKWRSCLGQGLGVLCTSG